MLGLPGAKPDGGSVIPGGGCLPARIYLWSHQLPLVSTCKWAAGASVAKDVGFVEEPEHLWDAQPSTRCRQRLIGTLDTHEHEGIFVLA